MPQVRYSRKADADIEEIASFTLKKWGFAQAESYVDDLYGACRLIAQNTLIGRPCVTHPSWRRLEHQSHIIVYSKSRAGITVHRIVHKNRQFVRAIR